MAGWKRLAALALLATFALAGCTATRDAVQPAPGPAAGEDDVVEPIASEPEAGEAPAAPEPKPSEKPEKAKPESPPPAPEQPPQQPPAPSEGEESTKFEKRLDILVDQDFVAPDAAGLLTAKFDVAHEYQTLEVLGAYLGVASYASELQVIVKDGSGKTVVSYNGLNVLAGITGFGGGSLDSFPIGYAYDVEKGPYTMQVVSAGSPVHVTVRGHLGADMDFTFHNSVTAGRDQVSNYRGKVVLVDLMATWCGPCQKAMPGLKQIRDDYAGKVEILSIDVDNEETDQELLAMRSKYGADWPFGFDDQGEASDAFGTGWIPSFGVIDQHGVLLFRHIGEMEPGDLREIIDYALGSR